MLRHSPVSKVPTPLATALNWRALGASDGTVAAGFKAELLPLDVLGAPAASELAHRVAIAKDGTIYLYDPAGRILRLLTDGKLEVFTTSAAVSEMVTASDGKLFVGAGTALTAYTLDANKRAVATASGKLPDATESIALGSDGTVAFPFNTEGMYRGWIGADGEPHVAIYREDALPLPH